MLTPTNNCLRFGAFEFAPLEPGGSIHPTTLQREQNGVVLKRQMKGRRSNVIGAQIPLNPEQQGAFGSPVVSITFRELNAFKKLIREADPTLFENPIGNASLKTLQDCVTKLKLSLDA